MERCARGIQQARVAMDHVPKACDGPHVLDIVLWGGCAPQVGSWRAHGAAAVVCKWQINRPCLPFLTHTFSYALYMLTYVTSPGLSR